MASTVIAGMTVTPENVQQLYNVFQTEASVLKNSMTRTFNFKVGKAAEDPVSPRAAAGFNAKLDVYQQRVNGFIRELEETAKALADAAKSYGHTEEQIQGSFKKFGPGYLQRNGFSNAVQR